MPHDEWGYTQTDRSQLGRCFDTVSPQAVQGNGPVRLTTPRTLQVRRPAVHRATKRNGLPTFDTTGNHITGPMVHLGSTQPKHTY